MQFRLMRLMRIQDTADLRIVMACLGNLRQFMDRFTEQFQLRDPCFIERVIGRWLGC